MEDYDVVEEKEEDAEDLMENDEVSPEEEGFLKGYEEIDEPTEPEEEEPSSDDDS